jgi:hypothetical protein
MFWFNFTARHYSRDFMDAALHEMYGLPRTVIRTRGKVRALTRWGAQRYIRRMCGSPLIEIVACERDVEALLHWSTVTRVYAVALVGVPLLLAAVVLAVLR